MNGLECRLHPAILGWLHDRPQDSSSIRLLGCPRNAAPRTARDARQLGILVLEGSRADRIVIDCGGVSRDDNTGLAVLLDWLAWGRRKSRSVKLEYLPESPLDIARTSEFDTLLAV